MIYDPCGVVDVEPITPALRPTSLDGCRLGVLSNTKWNAAKLLRATVRALETGGVTFKSITFYDKEHFSSDASPEVIRNIATESDLVLTAIGDCGSCTSSCVNDAVRLEAQGVPTAVIITTEFVYEAELQREARGMGDLRLVVVTHPISSLQLVELDGRAAEIVPQAIAIWTTSATSNANHS
jgi:hypothetical protein